MDSSPSRQQERLSVTLSLPKPVGSTDNETASGKAGAKKPVVPIINATASFLRADPNLQPFQHEKLFISYSPRLPFLHRRAMLECTRRLRDQGVTSLWFDREQGVLEHLVCSDHRFRAAEKCEVFMAFLDDNYLDTRQSLNELKIAAVRQATSHANEVPPFILAIVLDEVSSDSLLSNCESTLQVKFDAVCKFGAPAHAIYERAFEFMAAFGEKLEQFATFSSPATPDHIAHRPFSFTAKRMMDWSVGEVQTWLQHMGIKEVYTLSFAEWQIDGFLLASLTDADMAEHLSIDNAPVRRKLLKSVDSILDAERHLPVNWHLRLQRSKAEKNTVFIVTDPASALDAKLSDAIRTELSKAGFSSYQRVDVEQCDRMIAPALCTSSHVLFLLTPFSAGNEIANNDLLLADYCDRLTANQTCVCVFKRNAIMRLPNRLRAILSGVTAIDFESEPYAKCKQFLLHWLNPVDLRGVVMDQALLGRLQDGLQSFSQLLSGAAQKYSSPSTDTAVTSSESVASLTYTGASMSVEQPASRATFVAAAQKHNAYFSYPDQMHSRILSVIRVLDANNYTSILPTQPATSEINTGARVAQASVNELLVANNLQALRNSDCLVLCITPTYITSQTCLHDVVQAELLEKAVVPVLLAPTKLPPANARLKKILTGNKFVDFSCEKFVIRNMPYFLERIRSAVSGNPKL